MTPSPEQLRRDYETVTSAIRALGNAWVREEVPTAAQGLRLVSEANIAIARLAVFAGVPLDPLPPPRGRA